MAVVLMVHPPVKISKALIRTTEQKMPMPDLSHELAELLRLRDPRYVGRILSVHQQKVLGWTYSRYADDLTFSASGEPGTKIGYLHRVRGIVHEESFIINELKTRVRRKSDHQRVTGLIVNNKIGVPRKTVRKLRAILHQAQYSDLESQNRGRTEGQFHHWVQGMIGFVHLSAPEKGLKLLSAFQKIKNP